MKRYNFGAGPAILSSEVIDEIAQAVSDYNGLGLSLLELSHRGKEYDKIAQESLSLVRELLDLPDHYHPLFLWGGATALFSLIPYNILPSSGKVGFIDTGVWSAKAVKGASYYGSTEVLASSKDRNYRYIPKDFDIREDLSYVHLTSNNTIYGTQFHQYPESPVSVVADFSSDIFSRPVDSTQFDLMYASAQKNLGPVGTVLVVIHEKLFERSGKDIPDIFNFKKHVEKESRLNTPPTLSIFGCLANMRWIKRLGLDNIANRNQEKAQALYAAIDQSDFFHCPISTEDRSIMNVCFTAKDTSRDQAFLEFCDSRGIFALKGHRLSAGFRASIYNAMEMEGVKHLIETIQLFEKEHA